MICTTSGHYAIPITKSSLDVTNKTEDHRSLVLFAEEEIIDKKAAAKKLHTQFCHPSARRLKKFVESSRYSDKELMKAIEEVSDACDVCKRYKKTVPRPVVAFPLSSRFNETIAMDLKIFKNNSIYFLHIIDHLTRMSAAAVIRSKRQEVIMEAFCRIWIAVFGPPEKVLSDNGGEFANAGFIDLCQNFNINFQTTAAEAPWSNGLVEKHNGIMGEAVAKIMEDTHCSVEVALCWAIHAKNSLQNIHGFSSYQLVFGKNPNVPSVFENSLPALESVSGSQIVADNLNALHKARETMVMLEASEKIRRALRSQTRTYSNVRYLNGEEVFYKRDEEKRWRGPGRVVGQDGAKVLIKIPTGLISVHSCRVILTSDAEKQRSEGGERNINDATIVDPTTNEDREDIYDADIHPTHIEDIVTPVLDEKALEKMMIDRSIDKTEVEIQRTEEFNDREANQGETATAENTNDAAEDN